MSFKICLGDITRCNDVDVVVNPANPSLLGGGGADGAIHRAAGPELLEECKQIGGCNHGDAVITNAYNLPCKKIIHTVGPIWEGGNNNEPEILYSCYIQCLQLAKDNGLRRIAFPSIATGAYGFPTREAAKIAFSAMTTFLSENPNSFDEIQMVLYDVGTKDIYIEELKNTLKKIWGPDAIDEPLTS